MFDRAERLQRQFFQPAPARRAGPCWEPPVDVLETDDEIWIMVALPGVEPDRLNVVIDGGVLIVTGERPLPGQSRRMALRRLEIPHGHFERRLQLPTGRFEIGERNLHLGCLVLSLRKLP
jgi:HSP20 family molecular chaperone IbpA